MEKNNVTDTGKALMAANARLAALGFTPGERLGLNPLKIEEGDTVFIEVTGKIQKFQAKNGKEYDFVPVTNLETAEADMTFWLSGQIRYQLDQLKDYVGKRFMITHKGQVEVDGNYINQFDIQLINN